MDDKVPLHQYSPAHSTGLPPYEAEHGRGGGLHRKHSEAYMSVDDPSEELGKKGKKKKHRKLSMMEEESVNATEPNGTKNIQAPKEVVKRIDWILIYPKKDPEEIHDEDDKQDYQRNLDLREKFELAMQDEGLQMQKVILGENVFVKLHTPFERLCKEAERINLEMPLQGVSD